MKKNSVLTLYRLLAHNRKLSAKRHPMFERQKFMKIFVYIFVAFWAVYLFAFGVGMGLSQPANMEAFDFINGGMLCLLILDFYGRFMYQETPAQEIKPYMLMPIGRRLLIGSFLFRLVLLPTNLFWFFFHVPLAWLSVVRFYGVGGFLAYLFFWWLLYVLNGYWYLLWRSFVSRKLLWIICPTAIYVALIYFGIADEKGTQWLFYACVRIGREAITWAPWPYLSILAVGGMLAIVNYHIQKRDVYREIAKVEKVTKVNSTEMAFLNRFGIIGEYMKLEVKSVRRNKVVRTQFYLGIFYIVLLCALLAFTDVYDAGFMKVFIAVYSFCMFGIIVLTQVMGPEGNYMDLLMSRKESVLQLLKAKYFFNCIVLLLPFLITLVPVVQGKFTILETLGCMLFSSGVVFPFLFILAIYNKNTIHLNEKVTRAGRSTKTQMLVSFAAMFVPMIIMYILVVLFSIEVASLVMITIGLAGTLLYPLWLRAIYRAMMKRRYVNMEGFRATR